MNKLSYDFYNRSDVTVIASELLGKVLVTNIYGLITSGRIVETEAYNGVSDKASHAWNNRRTNRTEVMYGDAGNAYVYLCYGIHYLFNVVTNSKETPHVVLIRAIEPMEGIVTMMKRKKTSIQDKKLCSGPGNLCKALGIDKDVNGKSLLGDNLFIADDGFQLKKSGLVASARIGVDYAGEDALLPFRYFIKDNVYVSRKPFSPVKAAKF